MVPRRRQTIGRPGAGHCPHWLRRVLRLVVPCAVAYGMAAHLIVLAFATTVMATGMQMRPSAMLVTATRSEAPVAVRLAMTLCRPGAAWFDAYDGEDEPAPEDVHVRTCCGICALQGAGLPGPAAAYAPVMPDWRMARTSPPSYAAPHRPTARLLPPVRGPPVA